MAFLIKNKNKLYVDNLDNETTSNLNNLIFHELNNQKKSIFDYLLSVIGNNNRKELYHDFVPSNIDIRAYKDLPEETKNVIKLAKSYFEKAGLAVDEYCGRITFITHKYESNEIIESPFGIHKDNDEFENDHTCIFYTQKDDSLKGGNLDIYLEYTYAQYFGLEKMKPLDLGIKTGSVVVFDGDLYHEAQPCGGFGQRNLIIVNLSAKK